MKIDNKNDRSSSDDDEDEITPEELQKAVNLASKAITTAIQTKKSNSIHDDLYDGMIKTTAVTEQKNILTDLIPGYIAPMKLDTSGLDSCKSNPYLPSLMKGSQKPITSTNLPNLPSESYKPKSEKTKETQTQTPSAGPQWFNMTSTPMTDEIKADLRILANRNYLDPKKFYKSADKLSSKFKQRIVQLGTVVEGTGEFFSNRYSNKERRMNLTEELMSDDHVNRYVKKTDGKITALSMKKGNGNRRGKAVRKGRMHKYKR